MIKLSNGHELNFVVASGALAYDGRGWLWERILCFFRIITIDQSLFTIVTKSLTRHKTKGNLSWWKPWTWLPWSPWSCVRFIPGGAVNKVGLTNPGFDWWMRKVLPKLKKRKMRMIVSLYGSKEDLLYMVAQLDKLDHEDILGVEINVSCPNVSHSDEVPVIVETMKAICNSTKHPVGLKLSVSQDYISISRQLVGNVEYIAINSVPWGVVFPASVSPLKLLEKKVGGGGGGVSGKPARHFNWKMATEIQSEVPEMPVIFPSIMDEEDVIEAVLRGAKAISFGAIHLRSPGLPTKLVRYFKSVDDVREEMVSRVIEIFSFNSD